MTTKPKARKFRIRRTEPAAANSSAAPANMQELGSIAPAKPTPNTPGTDIDAIRREGLTGRQLRMARRIAQKHNMAPTSDFDAVRLLRERGIDPFQRANMLELVVPQAGGEQHDGGAGDVFAGLPKQDGGAGAGAGAKPEDGRVQLPQTTRETPNLPATDMSPMERRALEITEIQKDIAKRRRRKLALLLTRLSFFVALPTFLAAWYFYVIATPMYSTKSEFVILQADNAGGAGLGGLLSGTQFATSQDSIAMQSFLESKEAMLRLDEDLSFKDHFSQDDIDAIQRLDDNPTNEEAYKTYKKNIKIGYDPTEGVIRMEVITADPQVGAEFSTKLIEYAQDRVNGLSQQKRGDQMADAQASFEDAMTKRREAQQQLVELQQKGAILDPEGVIASLRSQINNVELQLQEKTLQLQALLDNSRPNQSRVDGARGDVRRLEALLAELNDKMTSASEGENSLAQLSGRIQMAQSDLASRDLMLQSALQQMEQTRLEANRQVRYLTTSVEPVAAQEASYPRAFENTLLAFLIFGGIYLMISLTSSILREQVTS